MSAAALVRRPKVRLPGESVPEARLPVAGLLPEPPPAVRSFPAVRPKKSSRTSSVTDGGLPSRSGASPFNSGVCAVWLSSGCFSLRVFAISCLMLAVSTVASLKRSTIRLILDASSARTITSQSPSTFFFCRVARNIAHRTAWPPYKKSGDPRFSRQTP